MKKCSILFSALILFIVVPLASGQFEFGLATGTEYGFGFLARIGTPFIMLELGGGFAPTFLSSGTFMEEQAATSSSICPPPLAPN